MDNHKYVQMRDAGASPVQVCKAVDADGLPGVMQIRIIRELFGLSLIDAKATMIEAQTGKSLEEYQADLCEALEAALGELDEPQTHE